MDKLRFLDYFVVLFGLKGIDDYKTKIYSSQYKNPAEILEKINNKMSQIKALFNTSQLQLSRTNYKVESITVAFGLLKNLLRQAGINYDLVKSNGRVYLQLISPNNLLREYIQQKMENILPSEIKLEDRQTIDLQEYMKEHPPVEICPDYPESKDKRQNATLNMITNDFHAVIYEADPLYFEVKDGLGMLNDGTFYFVSLIRWVSSDFMYSPKCQLICNNQIQHHLIHEVKVLIKNYDIGSPDGIYIPSNHIQYLFVTFKKEITKAQLLGSVVRMSYYECFINTDNNQHDYVGLKYYSKICNDVVVRPQQQIEGPKSILYNQPIVKLITTKTSFSLPNPSLYNNITNIKCKVGSLGAIHTTNHIIFNIIEIQMSGIKKEKFILDSNLGVLFKDTLLPVHILNKTWVDLSFTFHTSRPLAMDEYISIEFDNHPSTNTDIEGPYLLKLPNPPEKVYDCVLIKDNEIKFEYRDNIELVGIPCMNE